MFTNKVPRYTKIWLVLTLLLLTPLTFSNISEKEAFSAKKSFEYLTNSEYLEDVNSAMTLDDVRASNKWSKVEENNFNKGFNDSTWWVRMNFENTQNTKLKRILEVSYPIIDYLEVYFINSTGEIDSRQSGDKRPFFDRLVEHRNFIFPISLSPNDSVQIYFKAKTQGAMQMPARIWEPDAFYIMDQTRSLFWGIYFGIMLVMVFYNLFIFFTLGERDYLYYVFFVASVAMFLVSLSGYGFQYLWPYLTQWNDKAIVFFLAASVFFGALFTRNFLNVAEFGKLYDQVVVLGLILSGLAIVGVFFLPYSFMIRYTVVAAVIALIGGLGIGVMTWMQNSNIGKYYCLSWSMLLIGGVVFALSKGNILPQTVLSDYAVQVGSAVQVILLSFALAERINLEKKLRFEAQEAVLLHEKQLREAQDQTLVTQQKTTQLLELRVKERTEALEKVNEQLLMLSSTDRLTGLKNRGYLDDVLIKELNHSLKWKQNLSVMLLDIDKFKQFNDDYGHLIGDECLKQVAHKIASCVQKPSDYTARYGGEEFCVILPNTLETGAAAVAERIRQSIENIKLDIKGEKISVTISIGLYTFSGEEEQDATTLLKRADKALYSSKANGRNQVTLWSEISAMQS